MKLVSNQSKNDRLFARVTAAPGTSNCVGTSTNVGGSVGTSTKVCSIVVAAE